MTRERRAALTVGLVAIAYVIAGKAGLALAVANASVTAIWPPTGIALAAILVGGAPAVAGVFLGALAVNLSIAGMMLPSLGIALGNTCEGLLGAALIRRWAGGVKGFARARDLLAIAGLAIPVAAATSATVGVLTLAASGAAAAGSLGPLWLTWWLGDLTGGVVFAPLLVLWIAPEPRMPRPAGRMELGCFGMSLVASGLAVFMATKPAGVTGAPIVFALMPVLTWAAFRLGIRETATAILVLSGLAVGGTLAGRGPFAHAPADGPYLVLQSFMAVMGVTSLVMAALVSEQRALLAGLRDRSGFLEHRMVVQSEDLLRTEAGFRRQAQILQCILDSISEGVMVVDRAGRFIQFNPEARRIWGVTGPDVPEGFRDLDHLTRGRVFREHETQACGEERLPLARALHGESVDEEAYFLAGQGGAAGRWLGKSARALRDGSGNVIGAVALVRDITAARAAREALRARDIAESANRTKSLFLATVSHELRTPLTAIIGYVNLLLTGRVNSSAEMRQYLERVNENGRRLLGDIDDLLDLAKIEAGRTVVMVEPVELGRFLRDLTASFDLQARARGLRLRLDLPDEAPVVVETDPEKLRRIVGNLVGNAIKFTDHGEVAVRAVPGGGEVGIRVADTGIGIPAEKLEDVFQAFHQVDEGGPRRYGGVGLGLAIARSLADLLEARLDVESEVGRGSAFTVQLPSRYRGASAGAGPFGGAPPAG